MVLLAFGLVYKPARASTDVNVPWDRTLAYPPAIELALAEEEVRPENWNRTFIAYASDFGQKMPEEAEAGGVYAELTVAHRIGKVRSDGFTSGSLYLEVPVPLGDDVSLWAMGYHDRDFREVYAGLTKRFGNWQIALGAGTAWYDGSSKTVIAPWLYYSSDDYEGSLLIERYLKDEEDPLFYKVSFEKKFGDLQAGLYGEKGFGLGPIVTWKVSKNVKFFVTVPVAYLPSEERMKALVGVKVSTE